jgi:hypothetical protein
LALGIGILVAFPALLYPLVVYPKFKAYAIRVEYEKISAAASYEMRRSSAIP